jgi:hypothetical protein
MSNRVSGAVVPDVTDEARNLLTIKMRNARYPADPLDAHFCPDLFSPAVRCAVYATRDEWRELASDIESLIERASIHWETVPRCWRDAYDWQLGEVFPVLDYPAWAHRAARNLLLRATSIFQHGGQARAKASSFLFLARSWSGAHDRISDAQLLATLAISQARSAARLLVQSVSMVDGDDDVAFWFDVASRPEWQLLDARRLLDEDIAQAIDRALLKYFVPNLVGIARYQSHAEGLLLLADVAASGNLSSDQLGVLLERVANAERRHASAEAKLSDVKEKQRRGPLKGAERTRKLGEADKKRVQELAASRREQGLSEKVIELDLARQWGVGRSTVQRALGKKK